VLRVLRDYEISQRRACGLIGVDPKTVRRERPPDHSAIRDAMKEVAGKRRRFGYRRIGIMLERQGMIMNHKKLYRLYRGRLVSAPASRPQTGAGQPHADACADGSGRSLVDGLRVGHVRRIAQVQDSGDQ
jgi:hypothetical protein